METQTETIQVTIDDKKVNVKKGMSILEIANSEGIKIPTLCHHDDLSTSGICRICVVEVEGMRTLQAACSFPVTSSMNIHTHSAKVRQARKDIIELMLCNHYGQCYSCVRNQNCELQDLANEYGVDALRFGHVEESHHNIDTSSVSVIRDMDKCILCRRCVNTCEGLQGVGVYEAIGRGSNTEIKTFLDTPMAEVICINCGQCINHCPTGALHANDPRSKIWEAIENPSKHVVIQTAPAPRSAIGECFGLEPGIALTKEMNTAIKLCGFDKVFDTNFSADLTIIEEGTELLKRLHKKLVKGEEVALPLFTSCSPGWVKFIEHFYPDMLEHLSTCKSPQQMFGSVIKTYYANLYNIDPKDIVTVALMPCTAKKFELSRPEMQDSGYQDVDYGLTTRELAQMLKESGIDLPRMEKSDFDDPFGTATGSGIIFGATGGVMESAIRTVYELVTGEPIEKAFSKANILPLRGFDGIRYAELTIDKVGPVPPILSHIFQDWEWLKGVTFKVAVTHGTANADKILKNIQNKGELSEFHFIEYMACTGGCLGGGGMPIPTSEEIRKKRAEAIYKEDESLQVRKSYENPAVLKIYKEFLTDGPNGKTSHKFLHTHYTERGKAVL